MAADFSNMLTNKPQKVIPKGVDVSNVAPQQPAPEWFMPGSATEAAGRGFANAATLGLGKYINAGVNSVLSPRGNEGEMNTETGLSDNAYKNYRDNLNTESQQYKSSQAANPVAYMAGGIAGSAPMIAAGGVPAAAGSAGVTSAADTAADKNTTAGDVALSGAVGTGVGAAGGMAGKALGKAVDYGINKVGTSTVANALKEFIAKYATPNGVEALESQGASPTVISQARRFAGDPEWASSLDNPPPASVTQNIPIGRDARVATGQAIQSIKENPTSDNSLSLATGAKPIVDWMQKQEPGIFKNLLNNLTSSGIVGGAGGVAGYLEGKATGAEDPFTNAARGALVGAALPIAGRKIGNMAVNAIENPYSAQLGTAGNVAAGQAGQAEGQDQSMIMNAIKQLFPDNAAAGNIASQTNSVPAPKDQTDMAKDTAAQTGQEQQVSSGSPQVSVDASGQKWLTLADGTKIQVN